MNSNSTFIDQLIANDRIYYFIFSPLKIIEGHLYAVNVKLYFNEYVRSFVNNLEFDLSSSLLVRVPSTRKDVYDFQPAGYVHEMYLSSSIRTSSVT